VKESEEEEEYQKSVINENNQRKKKNINGAPYGGIASSAPLNRKWLAAILEENQYHIKRKINEEKAERKEIAPQLYRRKHHILPTLRKKHGSENRIEKNVWRI